MQIDITKRELSRFGVDFYNEEHHDKTKILIRKNGISGKDLSETLFSEYNIEDELNNSVSCLFLTGIGTTKQKIEKLKNAIKKVETNPSFDFEEASFQPHPLVNFNP